MENKKMKFPVAAILILLYMLMRLGDMINIMVMIGQGIVHAQSGWAVISVLDIAVWGVVAVLVFMKNRSIALVIALAAKLVIGQLFGFYWVDLLSDLTLVALAAVCVLPQLESLSVVKKLWLVPGVLCVLITVSNVAQTISFMGLDLDILMRYPRALGQLLDSCNMLQSVCWILSVFFLCAWLANPYKKEAVQHSGAHTQGSARQSSGDGKIEMVVHVLLLLFTGGIWSLIWIYKTTDYLNRTPGEEYRNPTTKLLLCMFVPFYQLYWTYKSAQRIDKLSVSKGMPGDSATLCLVLAIFIGIVPPILMQSKINNLADREQQEALFGSAFTTAPSAAAPVVPTAADELKKYKELLDCGAISQQEYDSKKKQLLDL